MADSLEISGKMLHSIKSATQQFSYSRDYITRLAREGKIEATTIGRQWFVDLDSLRHYVELSTLEQAARNRRLSEERKQEQELRQIASAQEAKQATQVQKFPAIATAFASVVLCFGVIGGVGVSYFTGVTFDSFTLNTRDHSLAALPRPVETDGSLTRSAPVAVSGTQAVSSVETNTGLFAEDFPTVSTSTLGADARQGVLLLPEASLSSSSDVAALFSDPVEVREDAEGKSVVFRLDADGEPVGEPVPFVLVPVKEESI